MTKVITKEVINGVLKIVQTVTYSNHVKTRRILNPKTMVPESVEFIKGGI